MQILWIPALLAGATAFLHIDYKPQFFWWEVISHKLNLTTCCLVAAYAR